MLENTGALFSEDRKYRYRLWRKWSDNKPLVMFVGLNPSTANENGNDATIRRVISLSAKLGYGGVYMMNCFPLVSTDPDALKVYEITDDSFVINQQHIMEVAATCQDVIFAWGNFEIVKRLGRDVDLIKQFPRAKCLIKNKDGSPRHPLYVSSGVIPVPFI